MTFENFILTRGETTPAMEGTPFIDPGVGYLGTAQLILDAATTDIHGVCHDDVTVHEPWQERVMAEFEEPQVVVAGFGGALALGHPDIYKIPYDYVQLARARFRSNLDDAEFHGERFTGECDVAVLDSFALFIRTEWLRGEGGWPVDRYAPSHLSDIWVCLKAWQTGMKVRLVGVACEHRSGGAGRAYPEWAATTKWKTDQAMHRENHRILYTEFNGFLPFEVK